MSNAVVSLQGQANNAGDDRALFYKLFTGEVITAYAARVIMENRIRIRNIDSGKSAGFANTGKAYGRVHTPGTEIVGKPQQHGETIITVDDLVISDVFIAKIMEAMNHYEVRSGYSMQLGHALARTSDKQAFRVGLTAARSANKLTGLPGGTTTTLSAAYNTTSSSLEAAQEFAAALFASAQRFDETDVDMGEAFVAVRPSLYYNLVQHKDLLNKDWGGAGSYAHADLPMVAGFPLVKSNHIPNQDDSANVVDGEIDDNGDVVSAKYSDDYSKVEALIMTPDAVGCVKLLNTTLENDYDIRRQGTLIVASQAEGAGVLRPECAHEIVLA